MKTRNKDASRYRRNEERIVKDVMTSNLILQRNAINIYILHYMNIYI